MNWVCGSVGGNLESIVDDYDEKRHTIKGNLVLDGNKRAVTYATYYAKKGIQVYGGGTLYTFCSGPSPAFAYYSDNLEKLNANHIYSRTTN